MGNRDRGKWSAPRQADRGNKKRTLTLTPQVHEKLNADAAAGVNISNVTDEALRKHYGLKGKHEESYDEHVARLADEVAG
jgi:hypothetical protein